MNLNGCADSWLWRYARKRARAAKWRANDIEAARRYTAAKMRAMRARRKDEARNNLIRAVYRQEVYRPFAPIRRFSTSALLT